MEIRARLTIASIVAVVLGGCSESIDKSVLALGTPRRYRDSVSAPPSIISGLALSDALCRIATAGSFAVRHTSVPMTKRCKASRLILLNGVVESIAEMNRHPERVRHRSPAHPRRAWGGPEFRSLRRICRFAAFVILGVLLHGDFWTQARPQQPLKIFAGVTYGCERLAETQEGGGLVHWVRVDLTAPGVELYVTPLDPGAAARGWQYRLRPIEDVVEREHLAVAVNGTYFATASGSSLRLSGDFARSMQTLISDHVVAHGPWGASLFWFDAELAPHVLRASSAAGPALIGAKWAIGAHQLQLHNGQVLAARDSTADARTAIGIDQTKKLLFLAVGERISQHRMLEMLVDVGARDGFLLDGGGSSVMEIGQGSTGIPPAVLFGSGRPVATYIGVRAPPCRGPVSVGICD